MNEVAMQDAGYIIEKISEDARKRSEAFISAAGEQADQHISEARTESDRVWSEMRLKAEKDSSQEEKRIVSGAKLEARKIMLEARQEMLKNAFEKAAADIKGMSDEEYTSFLSGLIKSCVSAENASVFVAYNDRSRLHPGFLDNLNSELAAEGNGRSVRDSSDEYDLIDGFVVSQGNYRIDVSIKSLVMSMKDEMITEVAALLFEEKSNHGA